MPDEIEAKEKDSLSETEQAPAKAEETTPKKRNSISLKEHEDKIAAVGADWGRKYKTLETENTTLKSQINNNLKQLESVQGRIADYEKRVDDLAKDDPDKLKYVQKLRDLEEQMDRIKSEKETLDREKQAHQERLERADRFELELLTTKISEEFEGSDSERLYRIVSKLVDKSEENIRAVASDLWEKKQEEQTPKPDSGRTSGGTSEEVIRRKYRENPNDPKAYKDYHELLNRQMGIK